MYGSVSEKFTVLKMNFKRTSDEQDILIIVIVTLMLDF